MAVRNGGRVICLRGGTEGEDRGWVRGEALGGEILRAAEESVRLRLCSEDGWSLFLVHSWLL